MLLPFSADHACGDGTIDWVTTATLMDTTASLAVCVSIEGQFAFATIDLALQRIASLHHGRSLVATAKVLARENQVATVSVELYHHGERDLLGTARAGFWISDRRILGSEPTPDSNLSPGSALDDAATGGLEPLGLDMSGFERQLNLSVCLRGTTRSVRLPFQPLVTFNPVTGAIHGGFIAALMEYTAIDHYRLRWMSGWLLPGSLSVDFMRPARAGDLWAEVTVDEESPAGRALSVDAWQEDRLRPIASATAVFSPDIKCLTC